MTSDIFSLSSLGSIAHIHGGAPGMAVVHEQGSYLGRSCKHSYLDTVLNGAAEQNYKFDFLSQKMLLLKLNQFFLFFSETC